MSSGAAALLQHALTLSEADRLLVASALFNSVEGSTDAAWETAWKREIDERLSDAGSADEPWTSVRDELRASLR